MSAEKCDQKLPLETENSYGYGGIVITLLWLWKCMVMVMVTEVCTGPRWIGGVKGKWNRKGRGVTLDTIGKGVYGG